MLILPFSAIDSSCTQEKHTVFSGPYAKSSGVVVSPKEVFMNAAAAAAIPVSRSDPVHQ